MFNSLDDHQRVWPGTSCTFTAATNVLAIYGNKNLLVVLKVKPYDWPLKCSVIPLKQTQLGPKILSLIAQEHSNRSGQSGHGLTNIFDYSGHVWKLNGCVRMFSRHSMNIAAVMLWDINVDPPKWSGPDSFGNHTVASCHDLPINLSYLPDLFAYT